MTIDYEEAWFKRLEWTMASVPKDQVRYMRWQEAFDARRLEVLTPILRHYLDGMEYPRVADIGCGISVMAQLVSRIAHTRAEVTGVDISEVALAKCRERWPFHKWQKDSAIDPFLPPYIYDLVHAGEVIEHLDPDRMEEALTNWCRLVGHKGVLVITTPTPSLKIPKDQHLGFVSEGTVRKVMAREGLELVETHGIGLFLPLLARTILAFPDEALRGRLYSRLLESTHNCTLLADQAIYIGVRP